MNSPVVCGIPCYMSFITDFYLDAFSGTDRYSPTSTFEMSKPTRTSPSQPAPTFYTGVPVSGLAPTPTYVVAKPPKAGSMSRVANELALAPVRKGSLLTQVVHAPVSAGYGIKRKTAPRMRNTQRGVVVSHSEMVGPLISSGTTLTFDCHGYRLNPGVTSLFPWVSTIANNYEKYRFTMLKFHYVPICATSTAGRIGIGIDYDSTDVVPFNRQEFFSLSSHSEVAPWQNTELAIKCDNTFRFTGTHSVADSKLIDLGQLVAYSDQVVSTNVVLGDIYVSYVVEFIEPQQALMATQGFKNPGSLTVGTQFSSLSTSTVYGPFVSQGLVASSSANLQMTLGLGTYVILINTNWSSGTATITPTISTGSGTITTGKSVAGTSFLVGWWPVNVTSATAVVQFAVGGTTWDANITNVEVWVSRIAAPVFTL